MPALCLQPDGPPHVLPPAHRQLRIQLHADGRGGRRSDGRGGNVGRRVRVVGCEWVDVITGDIFDRNVPMKPFQVL